MRAASAIVHLLQAFVVAVMFVAIVAPCLAATATIDPGGYVRVDGAPSSAFRPCARPAICSTFLVHGIRTNFATGNARVHGAYW
jgi:hypothetical protein